MRHPLDGLARDPAREAQLAHHYPGGSIYAFERAPSTMDIAHQLAADDAPEGTLVVATQQEQGRGRLGRRWESPEGGIYCSLLVRPQRPPKEIPQLSLIAGLGVAEAIQQASGLSASIRWPNDVLIRDCKVAGILVESRNGAAVIGVGVNVSTTPDQLSEQATSLAVLGAPAIDPDQLAGRLCQRIRAWYDVWHAQGFAPIRDALRPHIQMFGHMVRLTTDQRAIENTIEGQAVDVDEAGRLVVRLDSGLLRAFDMGEVTLLR